MALKPGRCKNYGEYHYADNRKVQEVDELNFVCTNPECKAPLTPIDEKKSPAGSDRSKAGFQPQVILIGVLFLIIAGVAGYFLLKPSGNGQAQAPSGPQAKPMDQWIEEFAIDR